MEALGRHLLVELYECEAEILNDVVAVEQLMEAAAEAAEATLINATFHHFSPFGVSGVIVIQESHLAIHTWPEARYAAVDLFTCGQDTRPWEAFAVLKAGLKAGNSSAMEIQRGALALLPDYPSNVLPHNIQSKPPTPPAYRRDCWFTQRNDALALSLKHNGLRLFHHRSPYQKIELYQSLAYGKMLVLDQQIVLTEEDEYIYHEMIVHVAMRYLPAAKKALVIGGGDGGTMRELARYDHWESLQMVEIDAEVVTLCQEHFPHWWEWTEDPRCSWQVADVFEWLENAPLNTYDLIIVDLPQSGLSSEQQQIFYQQLRALLRANGILVGQGQAPRYEPELFQQSAQSFQAVFGWENVRPYLIPLPTYPGGSWAFMLCQKGNARLELRNDLPQGLRFYNEAVHSAAFALPNDLQALLSSSC